MAQDKTVWESMSSIGAGIQENVAGNTDTLAAFKWSDFGSAFMAIIEALVNLLNWFKTL